MHIALEIICFATGVAFVWMLIKMVMHPDLCGPGTMLLMPILGILCIITGSYLVQQMGASWISLSIGIALSGLVVKMFAFDYQSERDRE